MAEYIEREKIIAELYDISGCDAAADTWADGWDKAIDVAIDIAERLPAADVVEVVRCKDCKRYSGKYCTLTDDTEDRREPNDYCSCGERKEV